MATIPLEPIRKIKAQSAREICERVTLEPAALAYLTPALSPQGFVSLLVEAELFADAVRFLAFALPAREGVWWSAMTGAAVPGAAASELDPCYAAAENWVYEPTEDHRFACLSAAEAAGSKTAGAYAALGAFWSGGSMAPAGMPEAHPDPSLSPIAVSASILLAVASGDPLRAKLHFREAMLRGVEIGRGGDGRTTGRGAARPTHSGVMA